MRSANTFLFLVLALALACANPDGRTLADLHRVEPDVTEVQVQDGFDRAMLGYEKFLEAAPESALTPEAMRRLADLKLEKEYGILSRDDETDIVGASTENPDVELPVGEHVEWAGPLEAIELYDRLLETYPTYEHNDWVLYQKARAIRRAGADRRSHRGHRADCSEAYPSSRYTDEVQFRRAEYFFTRKKFLDCGGGLCGHHQRGETASEYYELALYKLGWALYMQELHDEALDQYVALLDYKVSVGYDFNRSQDETEDRRIADTFRVISLSFSSLGGPEAVETYFVENGERIYEVRIYSQLGEFYLDKLRYNDAAGVYKAFVGLHPLHHVSPRFSMRVVEIYEAGNFPILVLESKKEFADRYGLQSDYWHHFDADASPEVFGDLKTNLADLANHYHAVYQEGERAEESPENFREALHWYRAYLDSFPRDPETPAIHYRLADLLLEHEDFAEAAREYERTAYDHPAHEQSAAAGYAAIYAHRENEKRTPVEERPAATREAVDEHAPVRGCVSRARTRRRRAGRRGRRPLRHEGAGAGHGHRPSPDRRLPGCGPGRAAFGPGRRRAFVLRPGRLRAGREGLHAGSRDHVRRRRVAPGGRRQSGGGHLQAG